MYLEKNGFLVVNPKEMSFLTEDRDFTDDLECAELFSSNNSALEAINQFVEGEEQFIVLRCNTTIWLDEDAIQPKKKEKCCGFCECENDVKNENIEKDMFKKYSF